MAAHKTGAEMFEGAMLLALDERLTHRDLRVLEVCWSRQDMDAIHKLDAHQIVWLIHFKLLSTKVDKHDVVWVETTQLGRDLVRYIKKKRVIPCVAHP